MTRRVISARDQVALLAPWRTASYADTPEEERSDWDEDDWDQYHAEMKLRKTSPTNGNHPVVDQIHNEFNDWWENGGKPGKGWFAGPDEDGVDRGPIGHWPTVENFLKQRYPAAYRGLGYGYEEAKAVLDNEGEIYRAHPDSYRGESDPAKQPEPYETGSDAVAKYGYDPREIVSAAMYLHNLSRGIESFSATSWEDDGRLYDIARKRHQMQRDYEQRQDAGLRLAMLVNSRGNVARGAEDADFAPYDGPWPLHTAMTKRKPVYFALHPKNPGHAMAYWGDRREPIAEVKWTTKGKPGYSEDWEPTPEEQGSVDWVWSHPHARRKGITRSLLQWVKDNHEPNLHGSTNMTPAGKALSEALGEHVDDSHWNRLQPVRGYNRPIEDAPYRMVDEGREKWEANGRPGNYI